MIKNFRKKTVCIVSAILGCIVLSPKLAFSQTVSESTKNITGTWEFASRNGVGGPNANVLRINHNTSTNVITGRIFNTPTNPGQCIQGYYLPTPRRIVFIRKATLDCTSPAIQFYHGSVYYNGESMGFEFHSWDSSGSSLPLPESGVDANLYVIKVSNTP